MPVTIFTIGHSSHPAPRFAALLREHGVQVLADIRSQPASRFAPQFNRAAMAGWLADAGVAYRWLGAALGGRPRDAAVYDADGRPDYAKCAARSDFLAGIAELLSLAAGRPTAIMCAEREPLRCHRMHLVTPALVARGAVVRHILADGAIIGHAALQQQMQMPVQPDLFG